VEIGSESDNQLCPIKPKAKTYMKSRTNFLITSSCVPDAKLRRDCLNFLVRKIQFSAPDVFDKLHFKRLS
jgi:hypothetical protein